MLKGIIFDFDGLILDTETPEFDVLQEIYAEYGAELSMTQTMICLVWIRASLEKRCILKEEWS